MKRKDVVKEIWQMGRGIMIDEWVKSITDEFIVLQARIANLEKLLEKEKKVPKGSAEAVMGGKRT